jgi:hypothetical protein
MADHAEATGAHPDRDLGEHERTYRNFLVFTKWAVIVIVLILIGMALFLT